MNEIPAMKSLSQRIREVEAELAFALAQGDGYAEDAAAARLAELRRLAAIRKADA